MPNNALGNYDFYEIIGETWAFKDFFWGSFACAFFPVIFGFYQAF